MYDEVAKKGAQAGMPDGEYEKYIRHIAKETVPSAISDEALEDPEAAVEEVLNYQKNRFWKERAAKWWQTLSVPLKAAGDILSKKVAEYEGKKEAAFFDKVEKKRQTRAGAWIAGFKALGLAFVTAFALAGECHLLVAPLANYLGESSDTLKAFLWLGSIAAVLLTVFGLLAEEWLSETQFGRLRLITCGLAGFSLIIGYLRTAQCDIEGVFNAILLYCLWTAVTFAVPIACAKLLRMFWANLQISLSYLADMAAYKDIIDYHAAALAEARSKLEETDKKLENLLMLPVNMEETDEASLKEAKFAARAAKREYEAAVAANMVLFKYFKENPPFKLPVPAWVAIGAVFLALVFFAAAGHAETGAEPSHVVILCDRSTSSDGNLACSQERIERIFSGWSKDAVERPGSSFSLLVIGQDVYDVEEKVSIEVPEWRAPLKEHKRRWTKENLQTIKTLTLPVLENASGIVESVYAGAYKFSGLKGRKTLIAMSDLRQASRGSGFNFEKRIPSPGQFENWLRSLPSRPVFGGRLIACGFHTSGQPISLKEVVELREVWSAGFRYWGFNNTEICEKCSY